VTGFFIPGVGDDQLAVEAAYEDMCRQLELDMGRRPAARRILSLWTRRGGVDCVTEVGLRDPLRDGTVVAIFDMGPHQPFVLWWRQDPGAGRPTREILGPSAYAVMEFDT
jgi:hypothetical protein